jgi:hypothetical protein
MHIDPRLLLPVALTLALLGCRPDEEVEPEPTPVTTGTLRVVVVPKWEGGPFTMNAEYVNVSNYRIKVEALKFYWGDVHLLNGTSSTLVKDVELFNLQSGSAEATWTVSPGTWSGMHLGLGVPQAMNDADPINYPPGHPLDLANGTYWSWATAYRFLLFDGRYDLDGSGTGALLQPFSMHTGLNDVYREFDLDFGGDVTVSAGNTTTLTIHMAVDKLFYSATDTLDLALENQSHGTNMPLALELTDNAIHSFSLE